ncbi:MAG: SpoIID/LytB domain-containing protein [Clostridia bacterium]|nr:SpoIID/LytB domain-containing protein [Clostridia bacterium]
MSGKKRSKQDRNKLIVRIFCIFLALLMVGGVLYTVISSLAFGSNAAGDTFVRIGLYYTGSSVTPPKTSYTLSSEAGFLIGTLDSGNNFTEKYRLSQKTITITCNSEKITAPSGMAICDGSGIVLDELFETFFVTAADGKYISISGSNTYPGYLRFLRNSSNIQLVNVVELEEYVAGVIPNEIGTWYPYEAIKAFAVVVRSYTLSALGRHGSAEFDLCWTSHCQVYRGRKNVTEKIENAAKESAGMVMSYGGNIVQAYYSACTGGCTCGIKEVWGSSIPYLHAIATPWEHYEKESRGKWTTEYTSAELLSQLRGKGYNLTGGIADVQITRLAENSSYVCGIKVTDTDGKSITIDRSDKIRSAFGLYSSNFVVGKAGETVKRTVFVVDESSVGKPLSVATSDGEKPLSSVSSLKIATEFGELVYPTEDEVSVQTAYGKFKLAVDEPMWTTDLEKLVYANKTAVKENVTLKGASGSFVFDGMGWGHGVGMSQQGIKDLGELGADYKLILTTYFPGISVVNFKTMK